MRSPSAFAAVGVLRDPAAPLRRHFDRGHAAVGVGFEVGFGRRWRRWRRWRGATRAVWPLVQHNPPVQHGHQCNAVTRARGYGEWSSEILCNMATCAVRPPVQYGHLCSAATSAVRLPVQCGRLCNTATGRHLAGRGRWSRLRTGSVHARMARVREWTAPRRDLFSAALRRRPTANTRGLDRIGR